MKWTEEIVERCKRNGNPLASYTLAIDILVSAIKAANKWTKRCDDAKRIPDLLHDGITVLKDKIEETRKIESWQVIGKGTEQ